MGEMGKTDYKESWETRQSFLLKLSDALRPLADANEIQETVTHAAMNYFGADRCYYCEIEDGNAVVGRDASRKVCLRWWDGVQ